jgi:CHRD domain-containing protein
MSKRHVLTVAAVAVAVFSVSPVRADDQNVERFHARLVGFNEIGGLGAGETGAILSSGTGTADVELNKSAQTATYTLTYDSNLSSPVLQSHIHFGKVHVAGGVMVYFCANPPLAPPAGTPAPPTCPASGGTVTGTWTAANVVAIPGQNVVAGNFGALVEALESNTAYANLHTMNFKAGEIRGQMRSEGKGTDD